MSDTCAGSGWVGVEWGGVEWGGVGWGWVLSGGVASGLGKQSVDYYLISSVRTNPSLST